jgi:hypothetical protein
VKPDFLVVGAAKAGSTSLCAALARHPEVFFPERKELHFFSVDAIHAHGVAWYERWFEASGAYTARGEGSTSYASRLHFPEAAARIAAYAPKMKLIYIVREPLARIESFWMQLRRFGAGSPFAALGVHELPAALFVDVDFNRALVKQNDALVDTSNYWQQLEHLRRWFDESQIHVVFFEELVQDPRRVLRGCFAFLGVNPDLALEGQLPRLNTMSHGTHPHPWLARLWASPRRRRAYARLAQWAPLGLRAWLNAHLLRCQVAQRPTWQPAARAAVQAQLRADSLRLLDHFARPRDLWDLGPPLTPD